MSEALLLTAAASVIAMCVAIGVIALLRPLVRRHCGAVAVLRLWWIVALVLFVILIPKRAPPVWLTPPPLLHNALTPVALAAPMVRSQLSWKETALLVWLVGAMVTAGWLVRAQWRFSRTIVWGGAGRGTLPPGSGPAVVGAIRPRLALPGDFKSRYSPLERKLILLHEHIHQRRRDGLVNLGMSALLILQWFNPAMHWASRALCRDQECACDALVISRHPQALRTYADALLKSLPEMRHLPLVCRWQAYHPTVERIAMLKLHRHKSTRTKLAAALLVGGGVLASMLVYAGRPVADSSAEVDASDSKYRIRMVLFRDGIELGRSNVIAGQGKRFSVAVGPGANGYRISMVAAPHPSGIDIQAEIEIGAAHTIVSRPRLIVFPGTPSRIEITAPGGGTMRFDLIVDPIIESGVDSKPG